MAENLSNNLKAILIPDDVTLSAAGHYRNQFYTVQHFEYKCERSRDEDGVPFGSTLSVILRNSIKAVSADAGKVLFERLKMNSRFPYTFVFNATFDKDSKLDSYGDAMVVYGYVVDVEETHNCVPSPDGSAQQMLISFDILVSSITYLGKESNKSLYITHNCD